MYKILDATYRKGSLVLDKQIEDMEGKQIKVVVFQNPLLS
jgi:hypothetical protein